MRIEKGRAFLRTSEGETELDIEPLRKLSVGRNARLSLGIDPVQERAALLTVLAGEISFVATGGSRVVGAGKSVEINGRSHQAKIREMVEADRPVWRNELPAEHR